MRLVCVLFLGLASLVAQQSKIAPAWEPLGFLIGEWVGEGGGAPGQGRGGFSFLPDQDGRILIRKNHADYPATQDKPAYSHTDLTIVYQEPGETKLRAIYFDDEGHTIHYTVEPSADGKSDHATGSRIAKPGMIASLYDSKLHRPASPRLFRSTLTRRLGESSPSIPGALYSCHIWYPIWRDQDYGLSRY